MSRRSLGTRRVSGQIAEGEAQAIVEESTAEDERTEQVNASGHADVCRQQAYRDEQARVDHDFACGGAAVGVHDGKHANGCAFVVLAIEPGDGIKMWKLPEEQNA